MAYNPNLPYGRAADSNDARQAGSAPGMMYASGAGAPDPYAPFIEGEQRYREESDRNYKVQLQQLKNQAAQIAIQKGQAEANKWYNEQQIALARQKMDEDKRQFDVTTAQANQQFQQKQQELARQFDLTTAEGRRQFDIAQQNQINFFQATFGQKQAQFEAGLGEQQRQFNADYAEKQREADIANQQYQQGLQQKDQQFTADLTEKARQYDLSRADQREQFAQQFGLDSRKVDEMARQYDLTRADQREQFAKDLAEKSRQFNITASGYMDNGQNTLERDKYLADATGYVGGNAGGQRTLGREQFENQALFDWTKQAIDLASTPADWVKYKQMTSGVAGNAGQIPGLAWTQGGQVGNTAFAGNPEANSLQRVLGQMGVGGGARSLDTGGLNNVALTPEQAAAMQSARPVGDSLERGQGQGLAASGGFGGGARQAQGGGETAAGGQIIRDAAGMPVFVGPQGAQDPARAAAMQGAMGSLQQGGTTGQGQPVTNWAMQAANMIKPLDVNTLSPGERQVYQTADQFARNPQGAGAGWYENLDPNTKEMLRGAAQAQGHDWTTVMSRYNRSKWGGPGGGAMAA